MHVSDKGAGHGGAFHRRAVLSLQHWWSAHYNTPQTQKNEPKLYVQQNGSGRMSTLQGLKYRDFRHYQVSTEHEHQF